MLDLSCFTAAPDALRYCGANHYTVTQDRTGYAVHVETLDEDGNPTPGETYAASALSTALAIIERLEAGDPE